MKLFLIQDSDSSTSHSRGATKRTRELESRLAQLTEQLLQKQALLESAQAEKASLALQMERMEVREK